MNLRIISLLVYVLTSAMAISGCTTASYGMAPSAVQDKSDTFRFKIFVGGFSGGETSDNAVRGDIEAYQKTHGYKDYKVLDKRYNFVPSYFEYTVLFIRGA